MIRISTNEDMERLKKDFPLGIVLIAFSGQVKKVLPYSGMIEGDWDGLTVRMVADNNMEIHIPYLHWRAFNATVRNCTLTVPAVPGLKRSGGDPDVMGIWAECLEADPVGICAVLGFKDRTAVPN